MLDVTQTQTLGEAAEIRARLGRIVARMALSSAGDRGGNGPLWMASVDGPHASFERSLRGRSVVVAGAARSGVSAARLLLELGALVTIVDRSTAVLESKAIRALVARGVHVGSGDGPEALRGQDLLVVSPGMRVDHPLITAARQAGIEVSAEIDVAARLSRAPLICTTGTNGKTTTVELIGAILRAAGRRSPVVGNVGRPLSDYVLRTERRDVLVVEVSSFQLETSEHLTPRVAVLLNVAPDHLDRHGDLETYARAKLRLFRHQSSGDDAVLPADWSGPATPGAARRLCFGLDPSRVDVGATVVEGALVRRDGEREERILPVDALGISGPHNVLNALAAVAAIERFAVDATVLAEALRRFRGLPHRLERVATIGGVLYVNDSKATNVHAMECALQSFRGGIHLLAGGRDKDGDFTAVSELVRERVARVYRFGEAAATLAHVWAETPGGDFSDLEGALAAAHRQARPGEVVLLSPGCASFDQFTDFEQRGDVFRRLVTALASGRSDGQVEGDAEGAR